MNIKIMQAMGFEKQLVLIQENKCPFCTKPINHSEFRDELSVKEFKISGLCQTCQDETFGK